MNRNKLFILMTMSIGAVYGSSRSAVQNSLSVKVNNLAQRMSFLNRHSKITDFKAVIAYAESIKDYCRHMSSDSPSGTRINPAASAAYMKVVFLAGELEYCMAVWDLTDDQLLERVRTGALSLQKLERMRGMVCAELHNVIDTISERIRRTTINRPMP